MIYEMFNKCQLYLQQGRSELEETLKRLQQHKGVTGVIVVNGEILYTAPSDKNIETCVNVNMINSKLNLPLRSRNGDKDHNGQYHYCQDNNHGQWYHKPGQ